VAGSPVIGRRRGAFSTLLRRPGLRASSDGVLATNSCERKMLASTCLYSLYAWFVQSLTCRSLIVCLLTENASCKRSGVFLQPGTNCKSYYVCVQHGTSWHQFFMSCPRGKKFNTDIAACETPPPSGHVCNN